MQPNTNNKLKTKLEINSPGWPEKLFLTGLFL